MYIIHICVCAMFVDISHIINIYMYLIIQCMHSLYVCTHICHNHLGVNLSKSQQNRNSDPNE